MGEGLGGRKTDERTGLHQEGRSQRSNVKHETPELICDYFVLHVNLWGSTSLLNIALPGY